MMKEIISKILAAHEKACQNVAKNNIGDIEKITKAIINCYRQGGKVIFFGNGGSAADAQHLATELVCRLKLERKALPAMALNTNNSLLTAQGNDYGFETIFSRQIEAFAAKNDVIIGISTSGNSENVMKAIVLANKLGCTTIGFSGGDGGMLAKTAELNLVVSSNITQHVQEMHITVGHIICELVEEAIARQ
ncbi:MAG: D-sedoheptulose 7-phosphate isomerase [bacterium]|jgi:D-sedoheptulose 7-phosphate isomerase|nr:D-sedoheptulose 7-phosphate isomerase [bacterium]